MTTPNYSPPALTIQQEYKPTDEGKDSLTFNLTLIHALEQAIEAGKAIPLFESGGVILRRYEPQREFKWVPLENTVQGHAARALYMPSPVQFASDAAVHFKDGWRLYASFHTHPSFTNRYSGIDYAELFPAFKYNFIYSVVDNKLARYKWINDTDLETHNILL